MSLDRRLRDAFHRAATAVEPDVEHRLDQTLRRGDRSRHDVGLGGVLAAAAGIAVIVLLVRFVGVPLVGTDEPTPTPVESPAAVAGVFRTMLPASDPGVVVGNLDLAGTWEMSLLPNGVIELVPPASFAGSRAEGHLYTVAGATLRTDLYFNDYCDSVGEYAWSVTSTELVLTVRADDCQVRRVLLSTQPWVRAE